MGDLTIDSSVMHQVSSQVQRAGAEFTGERALTAADTGVFGADVVASAFRAAAAALDAMVRALGQNATALSTSVAEVASTMSRTDAGLARSVL